MPARSKTSSPFCVHAHRVALGEVALAQAHDERVLDQAYSRYLPRMVDRPSRTSGFALPGEDTVLAGIEDLGRGVESIEALLVSIGASRLSALGFHVPQPLPSAERRLYERLRREDSDAAHSRYNALVRRLVSFERAAECAS